MRVIAIIMKHSVGKSARPFAFYMTDSTLVVGFTVSMTLNGVN